MLKKEELMACIDQAYEYAKKAIVMWNDFSMQQIRLRSANEKRMEDNRQHHIEQMDERKTKRYSMQRQANYEKWRASPSYDPEKDTHINHD